MNKLLTAIASSLCTLAATAMLFSSVNSVSANTNNYDVNQDDKVNIIDILVIKDFLLSDDVPSTVEIPTATTESTTEITDMSEVTVKEQILLDQKGVKVTLTNMISDDSAVRIKFLVENNTNEDLVIVSDDESVNGYMYFVGMYADVVAGKKKVTEACLYKERLTESNINVIKEIELKFRSYSSVTYEDYFKSDSVRIETSAYRKPITVQTIPVEQPVIVTEVSEITTEPVIETTMTETTTEVTAVTTTAIETTTTTEATTSTKASECLLDTVEMAEGPVTIEIGTAKLSTDLTRLAVSLTLINNTENLLQVDAINAQTNSSKTTAEIPCDVLTPGQNKCTLVIDIVGKADRLRKAETQFKFYNFDTHKVVMLTDTMCVYSKV